MEVCDFALVTDILDVKAFGSHECQPGEPRLLERVRTSSLVDMTREI